MPSASIRIDEQALEILRELARSQHRPMQAVLSEAIDSYRRQKFLEEANIAFAALRNNPQAWDEERQEREIWEQSIQDGLERE
jgi:predicted transcriptional regulator